MTIQTFRIISATGDESFGQIFDFQWKRETGRSLQLLSPEFGQAATTLFSATFERAERACWIGSQKHDPRPVNLLAQAFLPKDFEGRAFRGDLIVQTERRWWETYWLPCPDEDAIAAVEQLSLTRVAILPSQYVRRGCLVAVAPGRSTDIVQLVLAI